MLKIDTETMMIELTRGDSASIVFSAVDKDGNPWNPTDGDEKLTFAVAKKWGGETLMEITNEFDPEDEDALEMDVGDGSTTLYTYCHLKK